jgi:scyllo-inositol 2-dehydrogenase (NADP+)
MNNIAPMRDITKVFKTGLCSFGMSGQLFQAPFIEAHPGFALSSIVERSPKNAATSYPYASIYKSVEEMLQARPELDLIVVNTPNHFHYEHAMLALMADKHVIVEKPFTISVKEALALQDMAAAKKLLLAVYHNRRYDGDFAMVRYAIHEEWLGDIKEAIIQYNRYVMPIFDETPAKDDLPGTGVLYDLCPHLADQAIQLFGFPHALFADLCSLCGSEAAVDYFELILYYPRLRVKLKASRVAKESPNGYILHGTHGSLVQQRTDPQFHYLQEGAKPSLENWCPSSLEPDCLVNTYLHGIEIKKTITSTPGNYMNYFTDIYNALLGRGNNPAPASDGIATIRIIEAAMQSAREGRVIEF